MIYCSNENTDYALPSNHVELEKQKMKNIRFPQRCCLLVDKFGFFNLPTKETSRKTSSLTVIINICSSGQLKCDGIRAETRFRLSAKWTSPFNL